MCVGAHLFAEDLHAILDLDGDPNVHWSLFGASSKNYILIVFCWTS